MSASCALCSSKLSLFMLVVTRMIVSAASVLLLVSESSASALTLGSRIAAGQDVGSIVSMSVLRTELVEVMLEVLTTSSILTVVSIGNGSSGYQPSLVAISR